MLIVNKLTQKINPELLTEDEARAFVVFLTTEVERHRIDIEETLKVISRLQTRFLM